MVLMQGSIFDKAEETPNYGLHIFTYGGICACDQLSLSFISDRKFECGYAFRICVIFIRVSDVDFINYVLFNICHWENVLNVFLMCSRQRSSSSIR